MSTTTRTTLDTANVITVLDTATAGLWYHPDERIVRHEIRKFIMGDAFKQLLTAGAEIFEKQHADSWLSDDRLSPVLRPEDVAWSHEHWFPRVATAGWKRWAIVQPEKAVAQVSMRELSAKYAKAAVTSKWFTDPVEAFDWLKSR
jgi:hypothetical protein